MRYFSINFPAMFTIVFLSTALILFFGGREVIAGRMTIGTLVAFNGYVAMLGMPMRRLGFFINMFSEALASAERIFDLLDERVRIRSPQDARTVERVEGRVTFENVSFRYQNSDEYVLRDLDIEAESGQVIALLGKTGSGKTTVVNLIPRFYDVTQGSVRIDDVDVKELELEGLRRQTGIVLQESLLFADTIRENIAYGVDRVVTDEEIESAAKAAAIHDIILTFPKEYDTLVGEKGVTLSGGQRQRVAIARTLLRDPRILILDDATSSVDTETESQIREALERLMQDRTSFVIAHRIQSVMNADLVLVLDKGRIVQRGTHRELVGQEGMYKRIYDLQARIEQEVEREVTYV